MAGYFVVISFLTLPVFIFLILFKKKKKKKGCSWIILCYFHALSRLSSGTYKVRWSETHKLNFSILARQYFSGFYFRDFNRQIYTRGIKFRDSSVLNVTLMFVKSELFFTVLDKVEQAKRIFIDSVRVIFATFTTESYRRYKMQLSGCLYGGRKILEGGSSLPVRYKDMRKPPSNRIN